MNPFLMSLLDALKDTAIVIPILYLAYLLVGYFSHHSSERFSKILHHTKKAGPLVGAFLGCVPQCGFSSVISSLYSKRVVTLGTLFAVFIATSDEALPIMLGQPAAIPKLLLMLAIKVVAAIVIGYALDLVLQLFSLRANKKQKVQSQDGQALQEEQSADDGQTEESTQVVCQHCNQHHAHHPDEEEYASGCGHKHVHSDCCAKNIFLDALKHTAIIVAYVFVATLVINLFINYFGLDAIKNILPSNVYIQLLIACLVGLIPNCAASIFLVELYMSGVIMFAPMVAGLCASAGVGFIVLFTANKKHFWQNIMIVALTYGFAFVVGLITSFIPIV